MSLTSKLIVEMKKVLDPDLGKMAEDSEAYMSELLLIQLLRNQKKKKPVTRKKGAKKK